MFRFKPEEKYNIELQSPSKSLWSTFKKAYILDKNFKKFWKKLDKKNLCKDLVGVTDNFINSESYNLVSRFWCHCQINHYKSISSTSTSEAVEKNIRDYARHVLFTKKDFNEILNLLKNEKIEKVDLLKKHKNLDKFDSIQYNLATLVLFLISKNYNQNMYEKINKQIYEKFSPTLGIGNQIYNQHLLFSLLGPKTLEKSCCYNKNIILLKSHP